MKPFIYFTVFILLCSFSFAYAPEYRQRVTFHNTVENVSIRVTPVCVVHANITSRSCTPDVVDGVRIVRNRNVQLIPTGRVLDSGTVVNNALFDGFRFSFWSFPIGDRKVLKCLDYELLRRVCREVSIQ